jgi:hypothetical protein
MNRKEWKKNSAGELSIICETWTWRFFNDNFGELGDAPANRGYPMRHAAVTATRRAHNATPDGLHMHSVIWKTTLLRRKT